MKRIIVIGCPGSGKSTFSVKLCERTKLPLYHLDLMYWNADKTTVSKEVFRARLEEVLSGDEWIVDGNYSSTMQMRIQACDTVFFLDYPVGVCLAGVSERRGVPRRDMPWVETEEDGEFLEFVKSFEREQRPRILELLAQHADKNIIIFKSREEASAFFKTEGNL